MERINTSTKAVDLFGSGKHGFSEGDIPTGVRPTALSDDFFNAVQEELCRLLEGYGRTPTAGVYTQVRDLWRERERIKALGLLSERDADTAENLYGGACNAAVSPPRWVLLSQTTDVPTSGDGYVWTNGAGAEANLRDVVFAEGLFVAVGIGGKIQTSVDGSGGSWTSRASGTVEDLFGIAHGAGRFVACGEAALLSSPDGITWAAETAPSVAGNFRDVEFGNGLFVAVTDLGEIYTSPDGDTWTARASGTANWLNAVSYDGVNGWVAVGDGVICVSDDALTWSDAADARFGNSSRLATDGIGGIVAVSVTLDGTGILVTSDGGELWAVKSAPFSPIGVAFGGGRFVLVGAAGALAIGAEL